MADNYLEKRYEEVFVKGINKKSGSRSDKAVNLNSLLLKNRSCRGYDQSYIVSDEELREIVDVCTKIPSGRNRQVLRYKLITRDNGGGKFAKGLKLGGALPELHLPYKGTAPEAFIVICSSVQEDKWVDIDLGIAAQSILLKAVEKGLRGICIAAFDKDALVKQFQLPFEPLLVLAIGKGAEHIQLLNVSKSDSLAYWRKDGVHFVPKLALDEILL